jgi:hypothetical protein
MSSSNNTKLEREIFIRTHLSCYICLYIQPSATTHPKPKHLSLVLCERLTLRDMGYLLPFLIIFAWSHCTNAQPSPGYYPSGTFRSIAFSEGYSNLWGPQHQSLSQDQSALTIWLDKSSGQLTDASIIIYII